MEPQRGDAWGAGGTGAACLCPAALAAASSPGVPCPLFPRDALEQEVLHAQQLQLQLQGGVSGGDRRRERRMRNRESAERSRARRGAYMNELEKEVSLLRAENEELRKTCQELKAAAAEAQAPAKRAPQRLQRMSSASF